MDEYISKQTFKEKYLCCGWLPEMSEEEFDAFPAADVAQVRHGKWEKIRNPYGNIEGWLCGCGREVKSKDKYCPNCGVKMDKEK